MKKLFSSALFILLVLSISVSAQNSAIDPAALLKNMPNLSSLVFKGIFADLAQQKKGANKIQDNNVGTNNQTATPKNQPSTVINPADDKIAVGKTTFTPTGSFLLVKEFSKKISNNEEERKKAEQFLINNFGDYEDFIKAKGWTRNDVARSASSVLISCINIYNNSDFLTENQRAGIYRQSKEWFETDETFQATTNAEKQKAYEINVMLWTMIGTYYVLAKEKNDPKVTKAVGNVAAVIFEFYTGESIKRMKVTDDGLKM